MCCGCLPGTCAKGMEVVAPPAAGRPEGSKMEGKQRGCLGTRQALVCQLGGESPGVSGTLNCSSFLESIVGSLCIYEKQGPGPQMPGHWNRAGMPERQLTRLQISAQVRLWPQKATLGASVGPKRQLNPHTTLPRDLRHRAHGKHN
jgi:hypothetical protein